jgi:hypothetical protein
MAQYRWSLTCDGWAWFFWLNGGTKNHMHWIEILLQILNFDLFSDAIGIS